MTGIVAGILLITSIGLPPVIPAQLPLIVQDADTIVVEEPDAATSATPSVDVLPVVSLGEIENLEGARFGASVIDLTTGDIIASTGSGQFAVDDPDIFLLAYAIELMKQGTLSPDTVVGRDITIADEFWWAFHGCRESAARAMWTIGLESLSAWVTEKGMSDTELHDVQLEWEGAPETLPTLSSIEDVTLALTLIHTGFNIPAVLEIMESPDMGEGQASEVGAGWELLGWIDTGISHKTFILIASQSGRNTLGFVLFADNLCCVEKADLAMGMLWEAVTAQ